MSMDLSVSGYVAGITLSRPQALNALSPTALVELNERLAQACDDDAVRVILITRAGERAFCTGADLKNTLPPDTPFVNGFLASRERSTQAGNYARLFNIAALDIDKPLFAAQGFVPQYGTPEQVTGTFNAEAARWKQILSATQISFQ